MNTTPHLIINIGRQLGSGGHVIGQMLADRFGASYYDRELLNLAAKESGLSERFFEQNDEHRSFIRSFLHMPNAFSATADYTRQGFSQDSFFQFQSDAIRKAAQQGPCVFVGRCADYVLRDILTCVNIFVTAPLDFRIGQVAAQHGCTASEAQRIIEKGESRRAAYYNYYTGKRWGQADAYHLCVDSSVLGVEQTALFVAQFVESSRNKQKLT
jgi:cytidylate kinase